MSDFFSPVFGVQLTPAKYNFGNEIAEIA